MSRFVQGRRTRKLATPGVLAICFLSLLAAESSIAQRSPIQGDDVIVNDESPGPHVHPRVIMSSSSPVTRGPNPTGQPLRTPSAIALDVGLAKPISLAPDVWYMVGHKLDVGFSHLGIPNGLLLSDQFEYQRVDLVRVQRGISGVTGRVFAVELKGVEGGVDSDVAIIDELTGTEIKLDFNLGIGAHPRLATSFAGDVLGMVYQSTTAPSGQPTNGKILLQLFNLSLSVPPVLNGAPIEVNNAETNNVLFPVIRRYQHSFRGFAEEGFIVVWESFGSPENDDSLSSIQARYFDLNGVPIGGQFQVNTYTDGFQSKPDVATLEDGTVVIVWQSDGSFGNDDSLTSIQARRFGVGGFPLGPEFQVNNEIMGFQYEATIAAQNNGDFVVAWTDQPISTTNIAARQFRTGGVPVADQFQVSVSHPGNSPSAAALGDFFVVAWAGNGIYINGNHILFAGGFESGDTTAWSDTSP